MNWTELETLLLYDPNQRGVARLQPAGMLPAAARDLHTHGRAVGIVTGFCIADANPPAAETDGPPGAMFLARALLTFGCDVVLISDSYGMPLLEAACDLWYPRGLAAARDSTLHLVEMPLPATGDTPDSQTADWVSGFFSSEQGQRLSHLIAIERGGPTHHAPSIAAQATASPDALAAFNAQVPVEWHNRVYNMRGTDITARTAATDQLFEFVRAQQLPITTIAMADGGNEIGMGLLPWQTIRDAVANGQGGKIACRIATDYLLLAGVSNWAAYALAAALAVLCNRRDRLELWTAAQQQALIEHLVEHAGAVDGVSRQRAPSVDGLPMNEYLQMLENIRRICLAD